MNIEIGPCNPCSDVVRVVQNDTDVRIPTLQGERKKESRYALMIVKMRYLVLSELSVGNSARSPATSVIRVRVYADYLSLSALNFYNFSKIRAYLLQKLARHAGIRLFYHIDVFMGLSIGEKR